MNECDAWTEAYDTAPVRSLINIFTADGGSSASNTASFISSNRSTPEFILPGSDDLGASTRTDLEGSFSVRSDDKKRRVEAAQSVPPPTTAVKYMRSFATSSLSVLQNALSLSASTTPDLFDSWAPETFESLSALSSEAVHILMDDPSLATGQGAAAEGPHYPYLLLVPSGSLDSNDYSDDEDSFGSHVVEIPLISPAPAPAPVEAEDAEATPEPPAPAARRRAPVTPRTYSTSKHTLPTRGCSRRESEQARAKVRRGSRLPGSAVSPSHRPLAPPLAEAHRLERPSQVARGARQEGRQDEMIAATTTTPTDGGSNGAVRRRSVSPVVTRQSRNGGGKQNGGAS